MKVEVKHLQRWEDGLVSAYSDALKNKAFGQEWRRNWNSKKEALLSQNHQI